MSFGFLAAHDANPVRLAVLAERYFDGDPNTCLIKLRQFGEVLAQTVAPRRPIMRTLLTTLVLAMLAANTGWAMSPEELARFQAMPTPCRDRYINPTEPYPQANTAGDTRYFRCIWLRGADVAAAEMNAGKPLDEVMAWTTLALYKEIDGVAWSASDRREIEAASNMMLADFQATYGSAEQGRRSPEGRGRCVGRSA